MRLPPFQYLEPANVEEALSMIEYPQRDGKDHGRRDGSCEPYEVEAY